MFKILEKRILGPCMHYMRIEAPRIAAKAAAGQFVMVRAAEEGERIPLTISDYDAKDGTISLVFQEVGKTTGLLAKKAEGDHLADVLGPQGNPTEIKNYGHVVVVGGGIGVAPVYPLARALKAKGNTVTAVIGFRSKDHVFWEDRMRSVSDKLLVATNDGSYGQKGLVTDALVPLLKEPMKPSVVFVIGPVVMMEAVSRLTAKAGLKTIVSLNSLMVCGMGMCGACRVTVAGKTKFTCMDGADFDGGEVDFQELANRLEFYKDDECSCKKK